MGVVVNWFVNKKEIDDDQSTVRKKMVAVHFTTDNNLRAKLSPQGI